MLADIDRDWRTAPVGEKRAAMLRYAVKLTHSPGEMVEADVDVLRSVGFSDRDVHDICEATAYYAYVNRIADGLGVTVEDWYPPDPPHGHWPGTDEPVTDEPGTDEPGTDEPGTDEEVES